MPAALTSQVQQALSDSAVDPTNDSEAARKIIEAQVDNFQSLRAEERDEIILQLVDNVCGLGPLQKYLDDPTIEEIWIDSPSRVFVAKDGRAQLTTAILTDTQVRELVERMLRASGRRLDLSSPFVDAQLASGERLHAVNPWLRTTGR